MNSVVSKSSASIISSSHSSQKASVHSLSFKNPASHFGQRISFDSEGDASSGKAFMILIE